MKEKYIIPSITINNMDTEEAFAQSSLNIPGDTGNAAVINEDAQTPGLSRHGNLWTDED